MIEKLGSYYLFDRSAYNLLVLEKEKIQVFGQ